ncbi:odorant receptor 13a-like [Venturia canescens]|uniref:odorant receptor 13a-like n=1 Tax=Venturia canescens TaxID=32260 RepID=UPI001C9D593B|nr:odorant receptor 13a-like [Venturia canescens]
MPDKYEQAKDLFKWIERFYFITGTWPFRSMNVRFTVWAIYLLIHVTGSIIDLYYVSSDFRLTVQNLTETGIMVTMYMKMVLAKYSRELGTVIKLTISFIDGKHFRNEKEWELYVNYNRMAKNYFKIVIPFTMVTALLFWLKPIQLRLIAGLQNETKPYLMAYRVYYFFEINDDRTFYLMWFYQCFVVCLPPWYLSSIGLLVTLVLHISGQLSVLSLRVRNFTGKDFENEQTAKMIFQDILRTHLDIIKLAKTVNGVFGAALLQELMVTTVLIGLSIHATLTGIDVTNNNEIFKWLSFVMTMLMMIYSCCFAGQHLVTESANLCDAYYECLWYDMPTSCKKQLIICMLGASRPIQLSAVGFYDYSLFLFVSIVKTAAGYVSLLRTMTSEQA